MESVLQRNRLTVTAVAIVAAYILIALTTRFVLLGILPLMLSYRAFRRGEVLAPLALVAAVAAVVVSVSAIHH